MTPNRAVALVDELVSQTRGTHLTEDEKVLIEGIWMKRTYKEIASSCERSQGHIGSRVAKKLLTSIDKGLEKLGIKDEEITKTSVKSVLERKEPEINKSLSSNKNVTLLAWEIYLDRKSGIKNEQLELPEGPIPINSKLYIERASIEKECCSEIVRPGALIRIKAPGKTGKTSLIMRVINFWEQNKLKTIYLNFKDDADSSLFSNLEEFFKWFCIRITEGLELPEQIDNYWKGGGQKLKCRGYFENYLLKNILEPFLLAIDEVDSVFGQKVATDFFSLLRSCHQLSR